MEGNMNAEDHRTIPGEILSLRKWQKPKSFLRNWNMGPAR